MSSSLGGSWRVLRRQLADSSLAAELDKLLQRLKPDAPEHWDSEYLTLPPPALLSVTIQ